LLASSWADFADGIDEIATVDRESDAKNSNLISVLHLDTPFFAECAVSGPFHAITILSYLAFPRMLDNRAFRRM
jgi:hypothetical protein